LIRGEEMMTEIWYGGSPLVISQENQRVSHWDLLTLWEQRPVILNCSFYDVGRDSKASPSRWGIKPNPGSLGVWQVPFAVCFSVAKHISWFSDGHFSSVRCRVQGWRGYMCKKIGRGCVRVASLKTLKLQPKLIAQ
jgi:hypothetical protein